MKKNTELLLQIVNHSPVATAIYESVDLQITFANTAMLTMWGRNNQIIGKNFGDVFPDFTVQGFTDFLRTVWKTGRTHQAKSYPADITIDGHTETKYFDFEYQAVLDTNGKIYAILHTATDVTSRQSAWNIIQEQEALISFNNELELFTHTLSHDLRNPLTVVKMGTQYLRSKENIPDSLKNKWCDNILNAVESMENIINNTIRLGKVRLYDLSKEAVDMRSTIAAVKQELQALYPTTQYIVKMGSLISLRGEKSLLYQIFLNIIGNAFKYSISKPSPKIEINSTAQKDHIHYIIKDNGVGIPQSDVPVLFNVFARASNTKDIPGSGIGLCLVKRIMHRINGDITIQSTEGEGTIVNLYFPIQE
ncbi:ATP-binding protein [Sphingobacterium sp. LRF_L2]|uniref:ATP-binding protein n=1 Tax=Sphingobacterium sp. LRF_L2 TaxID=3369421 RepID=UPI003F62CA28